MHFKAGVNSPKLLFYSKRHTFICIASVHVFPGLRTHNLGIAFLFELQESYWLYYV